MQQVNGIATFSAPVFDNLIERAQYHPDLLSQEEKDALLSIIEKLQCVAICGNDECRELWLIIERGSIEDFGDYDEYLENEIVSSKDEYEELWKEEYPDPIKWYLLSVKRYNEACFLFIDSKLTLHIKKETSNITESINLQLISWIDQTVSKCIDWLKRDMSGYNEYINQHLPYTKRTGRILRQDYWNIDPKEKEWMLKGLTTTDIDILKIIVELSEDDEQTIFPEKMTSGIFFDCCKIGYDANSYLQSANMKPVDLYRKFADGRDFGLTQLNPDSPQAFEEWFNKREWQFGHPWEVCRGGNSTHISLYVDKRADGWRLSLSGKSRNRVAETVRFAIALYNHNIPFKLWDAKEILAMVSGTDYIGIVPEGIIPVYCHSYFPKEDCIVDFMNLATEERDKVVKLAYWHAIGEAKLIEY
ncbi:hypothetical protein D0T49_10400 [Paludibacter sp. 221]|uniref:hypothetical protein n=1 Tax=Paludibacter sp. 221 TaxID=2302939 RepID=UPI0013D2A5A9|nr:hypothetical protein [Paludibacter sp. 221]NDV47456.1 hypothetical protein [Paludibacter sp. 221]